MAKIGKEEYVKRVKHLVRNEENISILLGGPAETTADPSFDYIASEMLKDGHKIVILTNFSGYKSILKLINSTDKEPREWLSLGV